MWRKFVLFSLVSTLIGCATSTPEVMSQESLAKHIEQIVGNAKVSPNVVEFQYNGVSIVCISDAKHDRMRLISPVAQLDSRQKGPFEALLTANFHTALDARYAISRGVIYAAFLHPLSALTRTELESAIRQIAALSRNFGSSYSSDELIYGTLPGEEI